MNRWCSSGHAVLPPDEGGVWNRGDVKREPEPIRFYRVSRAKGDPSVVGNVYCELCLYLANAVNGRKAD